MDQIMDQIMDAVKPIQETLSPALAAISDVLGVDHSASLIILSNLMAITILCLILVCVRRGKSGKRSGLILAGLSDAGKTRIFAELVGAYGAESYASIKENVEKGLTIGGKIWKLVDVPGSERIRMLILLRFLPEARAMIFVVDSCRFMKETKDVAEFLYEILTDPAMQRVKVLIACNKQDVGFAKSAKVIRSTIEKEFCFLAKSRLASLASTDDSGGGEKQRLLGRGDPGSFSFDELKPQQSVEFVECTAAITNGHKKADLSVIEEWCASV